MPWNWRFVIPWWTTPEDTASDQHVRRRSNCFVFAWWLYWKKGGYIALRKSRYLSGWGWHWLWSPDLRTWIHYVPRQVMPIPRAFLHKLWYHGRIVRGDINGKGDMT